MSNNARKVTRCLLGGVTVAALACPVMAQEVLQRPEPPFKGVIGETYKDSTPDKIPLIKAPDGAPEVLVILIDDSGFGHGLIPTPNLDRLAASGTFRVLKTNEIKRFGKYHTARLVLQAWDRVDRGELAA